MASGAVGVSKELASAEEVKEGTVVSLSEAGAVVEMVVAEVAAVAAVGAGGCTESSGAGLEGGTLFRAVTLVRRWLQPLSLRLNFASSPHPLSLPLHSPGVKKFGSK